MGAKLNLAFFKNNQKSAIALITAFFILGITGAIAALANTLYPSDSILSGLLEDFSAEAHYLIRLRTWHPLVGGLIGGGIGLIAKYISDFNENSHESKMRGYLLSLMAFSGVGIGITTLLSLSPFTLKIIHLLWGHLIWLSLVAWLRTFFWERPVNFQPLIIYFDGVCNLCNFAVDYIHSAQLNLKAKVFLFAPLQGKTAQSELSLQDRGDHGQEPKSIVVKLEKRTLTESTAVMEILRRLDFKNFILSLLMELIPRPLRDIAYKFIAKNRYLFFGKKDSCRLPTAEEKQYFLD